LRQRAGGEAGNSKQGCGSGSLWISRIESKRTVGGPEYHLGFVSIEDFLKKRKAVGR
jgi:hypothetical protein